MNSSLDEFTPPSDACQRHAACARTRLTTPPPGIHGSFTGARQPHRHGRRGPEPAGRDRGQGFQGEEMRHGGGFRFLAALVLVGVLAALTAGAYGAGYAAGAGSNATVSPWVYGGFIGFGNVVGLIVTIFVLVMLFRVMSFASWGRGRGGWDRRPSGPMGPNDPVGPDGAAFVGPGFRRGWHDSGWQSARRDAFDEWHRRSHERSSGQSPDAPSGGATAGRSRDNPGRGR